MATAIVVGSVASLVAGGISYYSNMEQASSAKSIADYNASVQAAVSKRQAEINDALYQSQLNQAKSYQNEADAKVDAARQEQRRIRDEKLRFMSTQRAGFAAGGVVNEGSPLAVLSETSGVFAQKEIDVFKVADEQASSLEYQGEVAKYNTGIQSDVSKMTSSATLENIKTAKASAYSTASGYTSSAYGSLLSGVASAGSSLAKL